MGEAYNVLAPSDDDIFDCKVSADGIAIDYMSCLTSIFDVQESLLIQIA